MVATQKGATLVPQRAVSELQGGYQVAVVGGDNTVTHPQCAVGRARSTDCGWSRMGLQPGERVVVEGLQKVRNGAVVNPKPYSQPARARR